MSDEFEVTSVEVEKQGVEPVSAAAAEPAAPTEDIAPVSAEGGIDTPVTEAEEAPAKVDTAFDGKITIPSAEGDAKTKAAQRDGHAIGNEPDDQPEAKQKAKEEREAAFLEAHEQSQQSAERRKEWLERDHDFGGQKMSGHDLDKLIQMYANNPQMQDKLKDRLQKNGMSKDKADKTVNDFNEYMKILKKESEGGKLSEEELRRKQELQKDKDVRECAQNLNNIVNGGYTSYDIKNAATRSGNEHQSISARANALAKSEEQLDGNEIKSTGNGQVAFFNSAVSNDIGKGLTSRSDFTKAADGKVISVTPNLEATITASRPEQEPVRGFGLT